MMSVNKNSVKLNMLMNAILTMSSFIFPLITFPYVSRILLPLGTGKVNFATSVVNYFAMFAQLGIPTYGIRACAKVRDDKIKLSKTVHELLFINIFMCVLVYIVFFLSVFNVPRLRQDIALYLIIGISIILNALGVEWLYKALEKYSYITVRSLIFKAIALVAMFLLVKNQEDYVIYGGITIFAASASNILNFWNLRKYVILKPLGKYNIRQHVKMVITFFSMSIATTIYTNLDSVMLGFMKGDVDVGYYGAAVKIKTILVSLVTSASAVLLPRASFYVDRKMLDEFYHLLKKTMHFVFLLACPLTLYFIIFAKEGIFFLSGEAYAGSILPMQIIMPTLIFVGMTNIIGIQMLVPLGLEKQVLYSEIAGAVVDFILNAFLIPRYASAGAAVGTLVAEIVVLIWQLGVIRNRKINLYSEIKAYKVVIALVIATAASIWVKGLFSSYFVILLISAVCFFASYGLILLILKEQLVKEFMNMILNKFKR